MMNPESLKEILSQKTNPSLGLYIHIPFCRVRCPFCAFYVQIEHEAKVQAFLAGLEKEIALYGGTVGLGNIPVSSVYFGGGTPTVLSSRQLLHILDQIRGCFAVLGEAEISIEGHPGSMKPGDLAMLRSGGFNRLSLGVQSFDDKELLDLGGRVESRATQTAVNLARQAEFDNISLDLMYGFPGHALKSWKRTLDATIALSPTHLSCYAFTVEKGSQFNDKVERGSVCVPDEELQVGLGRFASEYVMEAGYQQYEISNFCQPGFACQHNLRYWQGGAYLGLGPSAQSFVSGVRFGNPADLESYGAILEGGEVPIEEVEVLNAQELQREHVVFGLRMLQGVRMEQIRSLSRLDMAWEQAMTELKNQGFLAEARGHMHLTKKGRQFADTVAVALL